MGQILQTGTHCPSLLFFYLPSASEATGNSPLRASFCFARIALFWLSRHKQKQNHVEQEVGVSGSVASWKSWILTLIHVSGRCDLDLGI